MPRKISQWFKKEQYVELKDISFQEWESEDKDEFYAYLTIGNRLLGSDEKTLIHEALNEYSKNWKIINF